MPTYCANANRKQLAAMPCSRQNQSTIRGRPLGVRSLTRSIPVVNSAVIAARWMCIAPSPGTDGRDWMAQCRRRAAVSSMPAVAGRYASEGRREGGRRMGDASSCLLAARGDRQRAGSVRSTAVAGRAGHCWMSFHRRRRRPAAVTSNDRR